MKLFSIQRTWKRWFAWRPVKTQDGELTWLQAVEWRHYESNYDYRVSTIYRSIP